MASDDTFRFPESLRLNGKMLHLVYDPGNPQRAQALPNYEVMIPLPSSTTQEVELPGVGKKWVAIVDAKSPAQPMQQPGGRPSIERSYLCFRLVDGPVPPLSVPAREFVVYAEEPQGMEQNRAQMLIDAVLGVMLETAPQPVGNWTEQLAQARHAGMRPSVTAPDEAAEGDGDE